MKVLHVIAGLDARYGGPSAYVQRLNSALREAGCVSRILTVQGEDFLGDASIDAFEEDRSWGPLGRKLRLSGALTRTLSRLAPDADIIHSHGLWLMPNVAAGRIAAQTGRRLVVSPHGMLSNEALGANRAVKLAFWALVQGQAYSTAARWIATSQRELEDITAFGVRAPMTVVQGGIDVPEFRAPHSQGKAHRSLLYLSRLHPHKNVELLIEVWDTVSGSAADWKLVIAGSGESSYVKKLQQLVAKRGLTKSVIFDGHASGPRKKQLLSEADLFILLSKSENFGVAVADALASGIPVIVGKGSPWSGVIEQDCGWWVGLENPEALTDVLQRAIRLNPNEREAMGLRGREWMQRDFQWSGVAGRMLKVYEEILEED